MIIRNRLRNSKYVFWKYSTLVLQYSENEKTSFKFYVRKRAMEVLEEKSLNGITEKVTRTLQIYENQDQQ